jgi:hypothetical protein
MVFIMLDTYEPYRIHQGAQDLLLLHITSDQGLGNS